MARLVVFADVGIPNEVDELDVEATASRSAEGATCRAAGRAFDVSSARDLPIEVAYIAGDTYGAWVAFRVTARLGGTDLAARTALVALTDGETTLAMTINVACLTKVCGAREQCVDGACASMPWPDPFDPLLVADGLDCETQ